MTKYRHTDRNWETNDVKPKQPRTCPVSGKRIYTSEREANATAKHRMSDMEAGPSNLRIYKCPYCKEWHLTSRINDRVGCVDRFDVIRSVLCLYRPSHASPARSNRPSICRTASNVPF